MLDEKRIQEIKERAEKATGEKWMALPIVLSDRCNGIVLAFEHTHPLDQECWDADDCPGQDKDYIVETDGGFYGPTWDDAQFIAHARQDIPFLLQTIDDLRNAEQGGWIAVETQMPDKGEEVLLGIPTWDVYGNFKKWIREVGWFNGEGWSTESDEYELEDVAVYGALPAPPAAPKKLEDVAGQEKERC